jgi:uncharacterized LabA/DUF88 family protein
MRKKRYSKKDELYCEKESQSGKYRCHRVDRGAFERMRVPVRLPIAEADRSSKSQFFLGAEDLEGYLNEDQEEDVRKTWILIDLQDIYDTFESPHEISLERMVDHTKKNADHIILYMPHTLNISRQSVTFEDVDPLENFIDHYEGKNWTIDQSSYSDIRYNEEESRIIINEKGTSTNLVVDLFTLHYHGLIKKVYILCGDRRKYSNLTRSLINSRAPGKLVEILDKAYREQTEEGIQRREHQLSQYLEEFENSPFEAEKLSSYFYTFLSRKNTKVPFHYAFVDFKNISKITHTKENYYFLAKNYMENLRDHLDRGKRRGIDVEVTHMRLVDQEIGNHFGRKIHKHKYAFIGDHKMNKEQIEWLKNNKYMIRLGYLIEQDGYRELGVDTFMAAQIMAEFYRLKRFNTRYKGKMEHVTPHFNIFSGDADFLPVYRKLHELNADFTVYAYADDVSAFLRDILDEWGCFKALDEFIMGIL